MVFNSIKFDKKKLNFIRTLFVKWPDYNIENFKQKIIISTGSISISCILYSLSKQFVAKCWCVGCNCSLFFIVNSNKMTLVIISINWILNWWYKCVAQMGCKSIINIILFSLWCSINNTLKGIIFAENVILTTCICNSNNIRIVSLIFIIIVCERCFFDNFMHCWWGWWKWWRCWCSWWWWRIWIWIWIWCRRWSIFRMNVLLLLGRIKLLYLLKLWQMLLCWSEHCLLIMLWLYKHFASIQWATEWLWWIFLWQECRCWWL